ncbi:MAG: glycerol-3-phosphate 1-O-acyltransferase PlsY [Flavobacteriales bacterium]
MLNNDFSYYNILAVVVAYLLGSIPTAVWVSRWFYHVDIREHGSGNAGATNTFRVLGAKAGIPVLIFDMLKGFTAVWFAALYSKYVNGTEPMIAFKIVIGVVAAFGHVFPVFAGFKGGKGVATLFGVVLALHWQAAISCLGIFTLVLLISRYVSLGSMITAIAFPLMVLLVYKIDSPSFIGFSVLIALLVILTHQKNISRLVSGEESRVNLKLRKGKKF